LELWKSDGTPEGTVPVNDINPEGASDPRSFTDVEGMLYFIARDGLQNYELWKSDGTAEGTLMVKDIYPGKQGSYPRILTSIEGEILFFADDGIHGEELWKSDGTPDGTLLVKDINPRNFELDYEYREFEHKWFSVVHGKIYFDTDDGVHGQELWVSDGTAEGTLLVGDIKPGLDSAPPERITHLNSLLFFTADDGFHGRELWALDLTGDFIYSNHFPFVELE